MLKLCEPPGSFLKVSVQFVKPLPVFRETLPLADLVGIIAGSRWEEEVAH